MKIRFLDLSVRSKKELSEQIKTYKRFLIKGNFVLGSKVVDFENKISKIVQKKYTIGCSSGTNALYLALKSIGIKKNNHVLVPCLSWVSTFTAVKALGAEQIGVDIDEDFIISLENIKKNITKKTKAIIIVYFTGYYKKINGLKAFCKNRNIKIIEDCAQSFGSINNKEPNGRYGDLACFSMNPMKIFGGYGDSGAVSTNDKLNYNKIKMLRYAGTKNKEIVTDPELNHKIDTLQAEILLKQLKFLKNKIKQRILNASFYDKNLTTRVVKPKFFADGRHVYYTYSILAEDRKNLIKYLTKNGIETKIQHPFTISDHPGLKNNFNRNFINGDKIVNKILSIPIHEKLTKKELIFIVKKINKYYKN
jgi:dTDP-4-amino-4,6-dideoxygalactose transaminase